MADRVQGFVLIEVILASALFLLLVMAFGGALLYGQEATALAGNRARAVFLAEEGLEAVRNIRDESYDGLVNGSHGLTSDGVEWSFVGTEDTQDIFTRSVTISDSPAGAKEITSEVVWPQNAQRTGSITLVMRLTDWTIVPPPPEPTPEP